MKRIQQFYKRNFRSRPFQSRMEEFIANTRTYRTTESLEILEEAGKAAGKAETEEERRFLNRTQPSRQVHRAQGGTEEGGGEGGAGEI